MASFTRSWSSSSSLATVPLAGDGESHNPSSVSSGATGLKTIMLFGVRMGTEPPEEYLAKENPDHDHWTIKKTLEQSDVDGSSRLLLGKKPVIVDHIGQFDEERGVELGVYDVDTGTAHRLVLKKWKTNSYILNKGWTKEFVKRRGLRKSDVIGVRWDEKEQRLEFAVIKWAPRSTFLFF